MGELVVPAGTVRDVLAGVLTPLHLTQSAFAAIIEVSPKHLSQIMHNKIVISPALAVAFEAATGIPAGAWSAVAIEQRAPRLREAVPHLERIVVAMEEARRTVDRRRPSGRWIPIDPRPVEHHPVAPRCGRGVS